MKWFLPAIILFFLASSSYAEQLEIVYVNANVGAAAGGHVGLKLDDDVFHYQFYPDGRFLLVRESWDSFRLIYNRLRNRTIYAASCAVTADVLARVRNHFSTLLASQKRDYSSLHFLSGQKQILAGLRSGALELPVRGLGFFAEHRGESESGAALRSSIYKALGKPYLRERRKAITDRLNNCLTEISEDQSSGETLIEKIEEISALKKKQAAYDVIIEGRGLLDSGLAIGMRRALFQEDHDSLKSYFTRRLQVLTRLLVSERSDIGEAILIETARCQALLQSLTTGVLVTLDPYPGQSKRNQPDLDVPEMQRYLAALIEILSRECSQLLLTKVSGVGAEMDYRFLQLENVNGRLAELVGALNADRGIRLSSEMMLPSRSRAVRLKMPILMDGALDDAVVSVENDLSSLVLDFEKKYRYRLIERNCVNQLLRNLNSSFSGKEEAAAALGDWIDPLGDRVVIPHDFFHKVSRRYHVEEVSRYPSRRIAGVEVMKDQGGADVWLREGNTLSTTLYSSRSEDTPFLFFTDDVKWARPFLGLVNLVWSTAHGLAGIVTLPVKGVEPVHQALRGMFYSLPELVFFNIRKGTYLHDGVNEGDHSL